MAIAFTVTGKCSVHLTHPHLWYSTRITHRTVHSCAIYAFRTLGYFINFYNITRKSSEAYFASVANDRMEPWLGSETYRRPLGACRNDGVNQCHPDSLVCHYMTAEAMINTTNIAKKRSHRSFGNSEDKFHQIA